jgi:hypothetical protein
MGDGKPDEDYFGIVVNTCLIFSHLSITWIWSSEIIGQRAHGTICFVSWIFLKLNYKMLDCF